MKYKYEFVNETVEIEVDAKWAKVLKNLDQKEALNERTETRRKKPLHEEWDTDWLEDKNECVEKEAAERLGEEEMIALAAGHLTKKQLVVFIYMYIYRLNGRMCADMMHITPSAVSQILSAIKRRLRCTPF